MSLKFLKNPRFWVSIGLLLGLGLCVWGPFNLVLDQALLAMHLEELGGWAVCLFILLFIVTTALGIPGTILAITGGAVFGVFWGTVWSVFGATFGAFAAFWLARYLFHDWAETRWGHHPTLGRFKAAIQHQPFLFVLAVRFAPISPFNVVNYLFGLTPLHWLTYTTGTFIGIIPGTFAYTWLGFTGHQLWQGGNRQPFFLALSLLTLLTVLPFFLRYKSPVSKF